MPRPFVERKVEGAGVFGHRFRELQLVQIMLTIWLFLSYQMKAYLVVMKNRREIVQLGLASLALAAMGFSETRGGAGMKTIYKRDLPRVSLDGW